MATENEAQDTSAARAMRAAQAAETQAQDSPAMRAIREVLGDAMTFGDNRFWASDESGVTLSLGESIDGKAVLLDDVIVVGRVPGAAVAALDRLAVAADAHDVSLNLYQFRLEGVFARETGSHKFDADALDDWFRERGYRHQRDYGDDYMERPRASERRTTEREAAIRSREASERGADRSDDDSIPF